MPYFSPAHHDDLVNAFWKKGQAYCPHDGKVLDSRFHPQHTTYLLVLACNHCGRKAQFTRFSDPICYQFRIWTDADIAVMSAAYTAGKTPTCPVCASRVRTREIVAGSDFSLECLRCGNIHLLSLDPFRENTWAISA
jgi:hypothetical protein